MKIKELLTQEDYKAKSKPNVSYPYFNDIFDYGVVNLFDELAIQFGRIPSQNEYIGLGTLIAMEWFRFHPSIYIYKVKKQVEFIWCSELEAAVQKRLQNTYDSRLREEQVEEWLKDNYKDAKVLTKPIIDRVFGSDIVIRKDNKFYYIHITGNTKHSKDRFISKSKYNIHVNSKDGTKHYWCRNWGKGHSILAYNTYLTDRMEDINGNLIFSEDYLKRYFDTLFESEKFDDALSPDCELRKFNEFLKNNKIDF